MISPTFTFSIKRRDDRIVIAITTPAHEGAILGSWSGGEAYIEFLMWLLKVTTTYVSVAFPPAAASVDAMMHAVFEKLRSDLVEDGIAAYPVVSDADAPRKDFDA